MIRMIRVCSILLLALMCVIASARGQQLESTNLQQSLLAGAHRVVFLGDSITYSGEYVDDVEAVLRVRALMGQMEFLDLGLPSETVSGLSEPGHAGGRFPRPDLHERLERVLQRAKPDLVIACYGMNDGIYYPFGEERFQKFQDGIRWMHDRVVASGARIIHLTPPTFDPEPIKEKTLPAGLEEYRQPYAGYNDVLDHYSSWLMAEGTNGWSVIDAHRPMNEYLANHRRASPQFKLANDGVHINQEGHWIIAEKLLEALNLPSSSDLNLQQFRELSASGIGAALLRRIHEKNRMLSDAWLTEIGHKRPGMAQGLPLGEAKAKAAGQNISINELAREFALQIKAGATNASVAAPAR